MLERKCAGRGATIYTDFWHTYDAHAFNAEKRHNETKFYNDLYEMEMRVAKAINRTGSIVLLSYKMYETATMRLVEDVYPEAEPWIDTIHEAAKQHAKVSS